MKIEKNEEVQRKLRKVTGGKRKIIEAKTKKSEAQNMKRRISRNLTIEYSSSAQTSVTSPTVDATAGADVC